MVGRLEIDVRGSVRQHTGLITCSQGAVPEAAASFDNPLEKRLFTIEELADQFWRDVFDTVVVNLPAEGVETLPLDVTAKAGGKPVARGLGRTYALPR